MQDAYGILGCYEEGMEAKGKRTTLRQQGVLECAIWRDFVRFQQQKIDKEKELPSPNRPEKRKNYFKIFITHVKSMIIK